MFSFVKLAIELNIKFSKGSSDKEMMDCNVLHRNV